VIPLGIDNKKILGIGSLLLPPDDMMLEIIKTTPGLQDKDAPMRALTQIQIMDRDTFRVLESAVLAPHELLKFIHLARAVGLANAGIGKLVDKSFKDYKDQFSGGPR
jgi:hypothetical protein